MLDVIVGPPVSLYLGVSYRCSVYEVRVRACGVRVGEGRHSGAAHALPVRVTTIFFDLNFGDISKIWDFKISLNFLIFIEKNLKKPTC